MRIKQDKADPLPHTELMCWCNHTLGNHDWPAGKCLERACWCKYFHEHDSECELVVNMGRNAGKRNETRSDNPYVDGAPYHWLWKRGRAETVTE